MRGSLLLLVVLLVAAGSSSAQVAVVGKWKIASHTIENGGATIDMHAALLKQRPCVDKIIYEVNADATFRLNAAASGCDERYSRTQENLYSKTKWRMEGNRITTSSTNFAVGQTYTVSVSGDTMTWTGTEGQGVIVYQKR